MSLQTTEDRRRNSMCQLESHDLVLEILVLGDYAGKLEERNRNT